MGPLLSIVVFHIIYWKTLLDLTNSILATIFIAVITFPLSFLFSADIGDLIEDACKHFFIGKIDDEY